MNMSMLAALPKTGENDGPFSRENVAEIINESLALKWAGVDWGDMYSSIRLGKAFLDAAEISDVFDTDMRSRDFMIDYLQALNSILEGEKGRITDNDRSVLETVKEIGKTYDRFQQTAKYNHGLTSETSVDCQENFKDLCAVLRVAAMQLRNITTKS
jgi:hypothetical protein